MQVYFIISCLIILCHGLDSVNYPMYVLYFLYLTWDLLFILIFYELFIWHLVYRSSNCIILAHCKNYLSSVLEVLILMCNFNLGVILVICCTLMFDVIFILILFHLGHTCFLFSKPIAMMLRGLNEGGLFSVFGRLLLDLFLIILNLIF